MKTAKLMIVVLFALLTAQIASAYYCPSTGRWLSRDPIDEPGFKTLQITPRIENSASSQTARWIQRDSASTKSEPNIYEFAGNNPIITIDKFGITCDHLNTPGGWDMGALLNADFSTPCGASGSCSHTVTVNGTCYLGPEVNYALYGKMCALCNMSQPHMDFDIIGWKRIKKKGPYDHQLRGALAWANAGYVGWPNSEVPYSDKDSCSPCSHALPDLIFKWHAGAISDNKYP